LAVIKVKLLRSALNDTSQAQTQIIDDFVRQRRLIMNETNLQVSLSAQLNI
jgi:hypothetical protein